MCPNACATITTPTITAAPTVAIPAITIPTFTTPTLTFPIAVIIDEILMAVSTIIPLVFHD
jgi:hypothetical protein